MILEAIYSGEIYPAETVVPESDEFSNANEEISRTMNFFQEKLSHEDYELLEKLCDHHADSSLMVSQEHFKYGFTMGVLLMCEIFHSPFFPKAD